MTRSDAAQVAAKRRYVDRNRTTVYARNRAWRLANPLVARVSQANQRAKQLGRAGKLTIAAVKARVDYYGGRCWICGGDGAESLDHVIPFADGGLNWPANVRPAHLACNQRRSHRRATCRNGHVRTPVNTRYEADGAVRCLDCRREAS